MSRMLIAMFWASASLMATANAAVAEPGDVMASQHDITAGWLDIGIDDDVFARPAHGQFGIETTTNAAAGFTTLLGGAVTVGEVSVGPFSSLTYARPYEDSLGGPTPSYAAQDSLTGAIGVQMSSLFENGMGPLETLIDLYLAHELNIDGARFRTLPGALRRNIRWEPVDPEKFDFENALSLRIKGFVPGYFRYETRVRVRSTGIQEVTGGIRFRW